MSDSVELDKDVQEYLHFLDTNDDVMDVDTYEWNFPRTKFVIGMNPEARKRQLFKVMEEVAEVLAALSAELDGNEDKSVKMLQIVEIMDVICACETLLRSYIRPEIDEAYRATLLKNWNRGYWDAMTTDRQFREIAHEVAQEWMRNPDLGNGPDTDGDRVIWH